MSGCCKQPSHLIVYGIKRKQSDVISDVYDDGPYTYENNKVAFKTGVEFSKVTKFDALVDFLKATNFNEHMNMNMNNYINVHAIFNKWRFCEYHLLCCRTLYNSTSHRDYV